MQKKFTRGHERDFAELSIVFCVVGDNDVATTGNGTLVLKHILIIPDFLSQSFIELVGTHGKYLYANAGVAYSFVSLMSGYVTPDIAHIGKGQERGGKGDDSIFTQLENDGDLC